MDTIISLLQAPAWPILVWCGLAATLAAAFVLPPRAPASRAGKRRRRWPASILIGLLIFTPVYGIVFESMGRADLASGLVLGLAHGALSVAATLPQRASLPRRHSLRLLFGRATFGILLGFLYSVPGA